jgi:hypothetical protein
VLKTLKGVTKGQAPTDFEYKRIGFDDYLVSYTTSDGRRVQVRIDAQGGVVKAPVDTTTPGAGTGICKDCERPQLTAAALGKFEQVTAASAATDLDVKRIGIDDFLIVYTTRDFKRVQVRIDPDGTVVTTPVTVGEVKQHVGTVLNGYYAYVEPSKVSAAALAKVQSLMAGKDATQCEYNRVGTDDYLVFFTTKTGDRIRVRVDKSGDIVEAPVVVREVEPHQEGWAAKSKAVTTRAGVKASSSVAANKL